MPASVELLVHTPFGKDAQHLSQILGSQGFECQVCQSIPALVEGICSAATAILVSEEVLASPDLALLVTALQNQPAWSAIPVLLFYSKRPGEEGMGLRTAARIHEIADVNFIERPVSRFTLISAVQAAVRDRQRQYRTRDLLIQLQEERRAAEAASHSKSRFLANMSHEIRTPLGAIMGYADLLALPGLDEGQKAEFISVIRRNSKELLRIIDDILDLSKVESGRMEFEKAEFGLLDFLEEVKSLLGLRAREKGIEFRVRAATLLPERIVSDRIRVKQILLNVVGNAIKFTESGEIELEVSFEGKNLSFRVRDTGVGISPEQGKLLFQSFMQADSSTTRKYGGTGLGLVITKRICEAMGGDFVLAQSELGKGSTFVAHIPVETPDLDGDGYPSTGLEPTHISHMLDGVRILLVEDSVDNQTLLSFLLRTAGASVELAKDGREGVEKALRGAYDAIVMDIQMPHMDGLEAVRIMRDKGLSLPILALTAHAMSEECERCLEAGFTSFLAKPVTQEMLLRHLHSMVFEKPV